MRSIYRAVPDRLIRAATETDATAIAQVHVAAWRSTYRGIVDQDHIERLSVDDFVMRWRSRLAGLTGPPATVLVATDRTGNIVGFTSGGPTREPRLPFNAELYAIYILQEVQRRGLGRNLVRELVVQLVKQRHTSLCVSVLTDNPACRFYERLGARWIRNEPHIIGGRAYQASWYGWEDLLAFADTTPEHTG